MFTVSKFTVTKQYRDFPAAHRQPKHDGHCRLIHGHNWGWDITFGCARLDENGFVVDVGKLDRVKQFLVDHFDHTLLLNEDDVMVSVGSKNEETLALFSKIVRVPNCGMEGLAKFVCENVQDQLPRDQRYQLHVMKVTCWEDSKNSATYHA